jgi:hypothetical protein
MKLRHVKLAGTIMLAAFLAAAPALNSGFSTDQAYAGNGNGNGNGGGKGGGNGGGKGGGAANGKGGAQAGGKSQSASNSKAKNIGVAANDLGALNAAHASARALLRASDKSRVGKIRAYRDASILAASLAEIAAQTDAQALQNDFESAIPASALAAYQAWQQDPTNAALQAAYQSALVSAGLTAEEIAALQSDYEAWQAAVQADVDAAAAETAAQDALEAAANKEVTPEVRAAVDELLAGK